MMSRRDVLAGLGAALAWPLATRAQPAADRPARIGILRSSPTPVRNLDALRRGLAEKGYAEGRGVVFVYRFGDGDPRQLPELAAALVAAGVDVIVTEGNVNALAARAATRTVPIVMATSADPQKAGIVESLSRPGGNVTGHSSQAIETTGKLMELAKELVPGLARIAFIGPPPVWPLFRAEATAAARTLGLEVLPIDVALPDFEGAFQQAAAARAQAALLRGRPYFSVAHAKLAAEHATAHRLPVIYEGREFVEVGGLAAYGVDVPDLYRRAATYIDKILRGAKPADLPIEQPTKFELVVNLKTAKALGITIPQSILLRADEVIE
jgi:putative ABC transport system substrate-binding protein